MPLLVRKIEKRKWKPKEQLIVAHAPGDAITGCLKTTTNTLSTWEISDDSKESVDDGILALVTGPRQEHIEAIHFVLFDLEELRNEQLDIEPKEGLTCVEDLAQTHRNIVNMTYARLGIIAKIVLRDLHTNRVAKRTRLQIAKIFIAALQKRRLELNSLTDNMRETIIKYCKTLDENMESFVE